MCQIVGIKWEVAIKCGSLVGGATVTFLWVGGRGPQAGDVKDQRGAPPLDPQSHLPIVPLAHPLTDQSELHQIGLPYLRLNDRTF